MSLELRISSQLLLYDLNVTHVHVPEDFCPKYICIFCNLCVIYFHSPLYMYIQYVHLSVHLFILTAKFFLLFFFLNQMLHY